MSDLGDRVALLLDRSTDALVAMLGIMRTGAAYVPIHPTHARLWQAAVLETIRPAAVVTSPQHRAALAFEGPIVDVTTVASIRVPLATARRAPDDSCYASSRRDRPDVQGRRHAHAALVNLIGWHQRHERLGVPSRTLQFAPLTFDVSFQEVFTTWCTGGTVVVVDGDTRRDPAALLSAIARERIDRLYMPFVALRQLAETARRSGVVPPGLRDIVSAGEVLHLHDDIRFLVSAANGCRLHNHYGPTEAHVVTALTLPADIGRWPVTAPLGRPIDGARVEVIDAALNPAPIGVAGQIAIGGVCLARGYVDQPALTGERFVTRPAPAEIRLYLTGDRGRWTSDGTLEFLGRTDDQVKIAGFASSPADRSGARRTSSGPRVRGRRQERRGLRAPARGVRDRGGRC